MFLYSMTLKFTKQATRIILQPEYRTPSATLFLELGWLYIPQRLTYNKAIFAYEALNRMTSLYITNLLTHLSLASHKRDIGKQCIPRSDATSDAASDQDLHCLHKVQKSLQNMIIIKPNQTPLYRK